jgi:hypothetical protein
MSSRAQAGEAPRQGRRPSAGYHTDGALALRLDGAPRLTALAGDGPNRAPSPVHRSAVVVARALLEVLGGWRPPGQLARWTSYPLQVDLERRAPRRPTGARMQLVRVRVMASGPDSAEICALAHDPSRKRIRVLAMRLEQQQGSWIVTRLQTG